MPRVTIKETLIYWILDTRPEKLTVWPFGEPFYCGKTVRTPEKRLRQHKHTARTHPDRDTSRRIVECGEHLTMRTMEMVRSGDDWVAREMHWIKILRFSFGATNISEGSGGGRPGYDPSIETRAKLSASRKGKVTSDETRAKLSAALKGRRMSPEAIAKMIAARTGKIYAPKHRSHLVTSACNNNAHT